MIPKDAVPQFRIERGDPDCFVCKGEGKVMWDDDQGRFREASFFTKSHLDVQSCPRCRPVEEQQ